MRAIYGPSSGARALTHGPELRDKFVLAPLLALGPEGHARHHQELRVVRVRHVEIMHQDNVRILKK